MAPYLKLTVQRRRVLSVIPRMFTNQLHELEVDGLVVRTVYAEVPLTVEYALSDLERSLKPVIDELKA